MELYYSNIDPSLLLHVVFREGDFTPGRQNIIPDDNFIQCSSLHFNAGKTFQAHKHKWNHRNQDVIAQESWCVLKGTVRCMFYDTDDTLIASPVLRAGDASFTLRGGHNYEILEDGSKILEYKTGPYFGREHDKEVIE